MRDSRLLKGEGVDVSLPTREDVNLQLWCEGEAAAPGSFIRAATLRCHDDAVPLLVESINALILEQRDLTFGKRASTLAIWRTAKAHKRLRRLVELCGVKTLTLEAFSWQQKADAFRHIVATLQDFAAHRMQPQSALARTSSTSPPARAQGGKRTAVGGAPRRQRKRARRFSVRSLDSGVAAAVQPGAERPAMPRAGARRRPRRSAGEPRARGAGPAATSAAASRGPSVSSPGDGGLAGAAAAPGSQGIRAGRRQRSPARLRRAVGLDAAPSANAQPGPRSRPGRMAPPALTPLRSAGLCARLRAARARGGRGHRATLPPGLVALQLRSQRRLVVADAQPSSRDGAAASTHAVEPPSRTVQALRGLGAAERPPLPTVRPRPPPAAAAPNVLDALTTTTTMRVQFASIAQGKAAPGVAPFQNRQGKVYDGVTGRKLAESAAEYYRWEEGRGSDEGR